MIDPTCRPLDADAPAGKTCRKCGVWKPLADYYQATNCKDGRRGQCKACVRSAQRERNRIPEAKERRRIYDRKYRQHPDVQERQREYGRKYSRTDKGKEKNARRDAARRAAGRIPPDWREARLAAQRNRCCYCRRPFTADRRPTIEHLLPVSQGGDNQPENLALACGPCNYGRANREIPAPVQTTLL